jgi:hypothetical protein
MKGIKIPVLPKIGWERGNVEQKPEKDAKQTVRWIIQLRKSDNYSKSNWTKCICQKAEKMSDL